MQKDLPTVRILGIEFYNGSLEGALEVARVEGGLILAPSGPGLADLGKNPHYDAALKEADLNLIDSGFLALLWNRRTGQKLQRHSGYKFIKALTEDKDFRNSDDQLWVMPSSDEAASVQSYLGVEERRLDDKHFYVAPYYDKADIKDLNLFKAIRRKKPKYIILAIAGGKQEVLGHWLREQLDYKPAIICIGAAIAFLTGHQASIPSWADRIYIGWLLRILKNPKVFLPRYWKARKLKRLLSEYGTEFPA
ncbi:glycosyltransferase [Coraliomargarita sinensis]|uniref:Glycosyltransferase n=1 Tax=Coraliomargarita sinensis TaxID=2174842 RepID=A0A317ZJ07_9BACT|nr:WecB/TagA/CpsF family glycosyltransferase [Coraliomargarita sinensis]PXA04213.1 glycosyltransferase [Coraliomargarita sinensis]